jgi:hypothetical protein
VPKIGILFRHRDLALEKKEKGKREKEREKGGEKKRRKESDLLFDALLVILQIRHRYWSFFRSFIHHIADNFIHHNADHFINSSRHQIEKA